MRARAHTHTHTHTHTHAHTPPPTTTTAIVITTTNNNRTKTKQQQKQANGLMCDRNVFFHIHFDHCRGPRLLVQFYHLRETLSGWNWPPFFGLCSFLQRVQIVGIKSDYCAHVTTAGLRAHNACAHTHTRARALAHIHRYTLTNTRVHT